MYYENIRVAFFFIFQIENYFMILNIFANSRAFIHTQVENPWLKAFKFHSMLPHWGDEQSIFL